MESPDWNVNNMRLLATQHRDDNRVADRHLEK